MAEATAVEDVRPLPENALLLHIGVFKTGTTALQTAMDYSKRSLRGQRVLFRGPSGWAYDSLRNVAAENRPSWALLRDEVSGHEGRVMVSAEGLCTSEAAHAKSIVGELGGRRPTTVLITIRSLGDLLPSTWQQFLKRGYSRSFEDWLGEVFAKVGDPEVPFWARNDFAALVRRWGAIVGTSNVVVAMSEREHPDRHRVLVEHLLGLAPGSIREAGKIRENRSMSHAEAELVRLVNVSTRARVRGDAYRRMVRLGVFPQMDRVKPQQAAPIPVPGWALDRAAEVGRQQARTLTATEAKVIGDLAGLARVKVQPPAADPLLIDIESAAAAVQGAVKGWRRSVRPQRTSAPGP